jgi:flagellar motor switch protein FliN/FliY
MENLTPTTKEDLYKLVDTEFDVDVFLGNAYVTLKDFLSLKEGDVISLSKNAGEGADIYVNKRIIGVGNIIVISEKLAVRIEESMDTDSVVQFFFEEAS